MLQLAGRPRDLGGGFMVDRLLPAAACRSVGPFVFADHFAPTTLPATMNIDVRPHPHIGLCTVTFLLEGALMHRDSLGSMQRIEPGAINWMSAGRGIVHSERTPDDLRKVARRMHGLQLWVGLPRSLEEGDPGFAHTPASAIPRFLQEDADVQVLVGSAWGRESPVRAASPTLLLVLRFGARERLALPALASEMAVLPLIDGIAIDGERVERGTLTVLEGERGRGVELQAAAGTEVVILGGDPLDGTRYLWWNFVSSRQERIRQAADDWARQRLGHVAGDHEFIPLPAQPPLE
jgi:redox-sensitive bicupin YhaK (pirin superfamily)